MQNSWGLREYLHIAPAILYDNRDEMKEHSGAKDAAGNDIRAEQVWERNESEIKRVRNRSRSRQKNGGMAVKCSQNASVCNVCRSVKLRCAGAAVIL